jgi:hypothetical protein
VRSVASTTRWIASGATAFFRPGRRASFISPGTPDRWKRPRQSSTVGRLIPSWAAMAWFAVPPPAKRIMRARSAIFCGVFPEVTRYFKRFS